MHQISGAYRSGTENDEIQFKSTEMYEIIILRIFNVN